MQHILGAVPLVAVLFGIYAASFYNVPLFHSLAEIFGIVRGVEPPLSIASSANMAEGFGLKSNPMKGRPFSLR